ncbi:MAG: hypothetical protein V4440_08480 [Pseudomonadota bacterium]
MKKIALAFLVLLFANNVFAVNAYDMLISQRNSTNTGYLSFNPPSPTSTDGIFYYNLASHSFVWLAPGNFSVVSNTLYAPQADWNSVSGINVIANKPTIPTKTSDLTNDSSFLDSTTGVTPTALTTALASYATTSVMTGALSGKFDIPTGTTSQFIRGDGTLATSKTLLSQFTNDPGYITSVSFPVTSVNTKTGAVVLNSSDVGADVSGAATTAQAFATWQPDKRFIGISNAGTAAGLDVAASGNASTSQVVKGNDTRLPIIYSGTTDGSGVYALTYGTAYSAKPKLVFAVEGGTNKDSSVLTATSTTGFSIIVQRRTDIAGLLPTYAAVSGATVNVIVLQ